MIVAKLGDIAAGSDPCDNFDNWGELKFVVAPKVGDTIHVERGEDYGIFKVHEIVHHPHRNQGKASLVVLAERINAPTS